MTTDKCVVHLIFVKWIKKGTVIQFKEWMNLLTELWKQSQWH